MSEMLGSASSARKMAAPMPIGTEMSSDSRDVTTVPNMNGTAPKFSCTGSQVLVKMKFQPNLWRDRADPTQSS